MIFEESKKALLKRSRCETKLLDQLISLGSDVTTSELKTFGSLFRASLKNST
jgi:hypothetical protein